MKIHIRSKVAMIQQGLMYAVVAVCLSACKLGVLESKEMPSDSEYLIGSYTGGSGQGIYRLRLDHITGELTQVSEVLETVNPSYIAWQPQSQTLFSVNEVGKGGITGFSWKNDTFRQSFSQQNLGDSPCYISISPDNSMLSVANYMSSDIEVFTINHDATDANTTLRSMGSAKHYGSGNHGRQEAPHPHWINWSADGRFIYAVDLGIDQVLRYQVKDGGSLSKGDVALRLDDGDGPRHMAFHPKGKMAYLINELSNTVTALEIDQGSGDLLIVQRVSSLAPGFNAHSQAAAIKLSNDSRFLYVSNRGAHTIAIFAVNKKGLLEYRGEHSSGGDWPRDFDFSIDGRYMLVANEQSNRVSVLKRDVKTGMLSGVVSSFELHKPTSVIPFSR